MDTFDETEGLSLPQQLDDDPTETIHLDSLFTQDVTSSGSFDIQGDIWKTTFGKLIQALPIPAMLISRSHEIIVANQGCGKMSPHYKEIQGGRFRTIFPDPSVGEKFESILDEVFSTRQPRTNEAILQIGKRRIWARMTFRSIRITTDRSALVLIEDLTYEKKLLQQSKKHRKELSKANEALQRAHDELEKRVIERTAELEKKTERFEQEITDRKRLEEQLRQTAKMEAIGTLASGIAHDFNNLLQVVLGRAEQLLQTRSADDSDYKSVEAILQAARNGRDLVNRILTFTRKVETDLRPSDLNDALRAVETMLYRTIPKMIEVQTHLAEDLSTVDADSSQIEQILLNLAINAKDAMPDGGKLVIETRNVFLDQRFCEAHAHLEPGKHVLLKVSDTGCGIPKDVLDQIFDPFFTTKSLGEGTGLGLAMVFGIVRAHRGHIICHSEPTKGTSFEIYFPSAADKKEELKAVTAETAAFGTETILFVDDDELVKDLVKEILDSAGYRTLTAGNGSEALEIYRKRGGEISLVILDLIMPEMGGHQCLDELLKIDPEAKVLIASGYSVDGSILGSIDAGAKGFIGKPYDAKRILQKVRKVLNQS